MKEIVLVRLQQQYETAENTRVVQTKLGHRTRVSRLVNVVCFTFFLAVWNTPVDVLSNVRRLSHELWANTAPYARCAGNDTISMKRYDA